jgi:hypothetical protein
MLGTRIDAVLDKLGHGLQRVRLRKGNDINCVPVVSDAQLAGLRSSGLWSRRSRHGSRYVLARQGEPASKIEQRQIALAAILLESA